MISTYISYVINTCILMWICSYCYIVGQVKCLITSSISMTQCRWPYPGSAKKCGRLVVLINQHSDLQLTINWPLPMFQLLINGWGELVVQWNEGKSGVCICMRVCVYDCYVCSASSVRTCVSWCMYECMCLERNVYK